MASEISIPYTPSLVAIEFSNGERVVFDIMGCEIKLEGLIGDEENPRPLGEVCKEIQQWIFDDHGFEISTSDAWSFWCSIRGAYAAYKKKVGSSLALAIVTASTPQTAPPTNSPATLPTSPVLKPAKRSESETETRT